MGEFFRDTTLNQFLLNPTQRHVSYFKSILMFLRQCMSQPWEKAHFLPVPNSPTAGRRVPKFTLHLRQNEGWKEQEVDQYESNTEQCVGENCRVSDLTRK